MENLPKVQREDEKTVLATSHDNVFQCDIYLVIFLTYSSKF